MRRSFFGGPPARGEALPAWDSAPCPRQWFGLSGPPAGRGSAAVAWCSAPRNPLFLRRQAPRLWRPRRCRRAGRGAPPPASPCSFVVKHHVFRASGAGGLRDVVLRSPQTLVLSSSSTTSLAPMAPSAYLTWCCASREPLFFRRQAPRLRGPRRRRRTGRGAPPPASPCSFVVKHHVFEVQGAGWADRRPRIQKVMHEPLFFCSMHQLHFPG